MFATDTILSFSVSLGQPRGVRVRLSLLVPVVALALMWRLSSLPLGLLASLILLLSVVLQQLAQVFVTQATGNKVSDIVLWPLGGLTTQARDSRFPVQMQVQVAGLAVNLAIAAICLFWLEHMGLVAAALNPLNGFSFDSTDTAVATVLLIYFANVLLLIVNLLPVVPFAAGRVLRSFLSERYESIEVDDVMLRLGLVSSLLGLICGFVFDQSTVVALSSFVLIIHLHEVGLKSADSNYFRHHDSEDEADEFSSLDSELEDFGEFRGSTEDSDTDELIARSSMMDRRTARRESEELRRESAEWKKEEAQVDAILERIHRDGEESLKPAELQLLRRISQRYRRQSGVSKRNTESGR